MKKVNGKIISSIYEINGIFFNKINYMIDTPWVDINNFINNNLPNELLNLNNIR
jgi:hypothetical protein